MLRRDVAEYDENDSRVWRDFGKTPSEGVGCFNLQVVAASMCDIAEINDSDAAAVELCSAPERGGLTPDRALMRDACAQSRLPVSVMIRPTDRDFVYTEDEFATMLDDVAYVARETKAEGISVGVLTADGNVDVARLRLLIEAAGRLKISFNRAFEQTNDPVAAYAQLARLKVASILTTVSPTLDLLPRAPVRLRVGGGVKPEHLPDLRSRGLMNIHMGRAVRRKLTFESSVDSSKVWEFTHA
ncbi:MAG: copper homeostasis protein CutC [Candidatus Spyradosoma sp.]